MRRPLLLNGFMGVGKSTVGRELARASGRAFIDLDERVEARIGTTIAEYFASHGEASFRAIERQELEALLTEAFKSSEPPIVAVGGGTLLYRPLRLRVLERCIVVTLEAEPSDIHRRTSGRSTRPLLQGTQGLERVQELLELRASTYAEAHARVSTSRRSAEAAAQEILQVWRRDPIAVAAGARSYSVDVGRGVAAGRALAMVGAASSALLISDRNVAPLHGELARNSLKDVGSGVFEYLLEPGEQHKNIDSIRGMWSYFQEVGADRKSVCVGLGGGVVTDMAGFAASTWMRGLRWVGVPTTLLAMVDASTGGKTGVDFGPAKNAVGAFWQPSGVVCDVDLEATEPHRNYASALAEVVKTALVGDPELLDLLESEAERVIARDRDLVEEIVRRSVRVKARIVSEDEREGGFRAALNLGHTVGHALEAQGGYDRLTHGEAISLGLVAALRLGVRRNLTSGALAARIEKLLDRLKLPTDLTREPLAGAAELLTHDKKKSGKKLRFVFAREAGQVELHDLELSELYDSVRALAS